MSQTVEEEEWSERGGRSALRRTERGEEGRGETGLGSGDGHSCQPNLPPHVKCMTVRHPFTGFTVETAETVKEDGRV